MGLEKCHGLPGNARAPPKPCAPTLSTRSQEPQTKLLLRSLVFHLSHPRHIGPQPLHAHSRSTWQDFPQMTGCKLPVVRADATSTDD